MSTGPAVLLICVVAFFATLVILLSRASRASARARDELVRSLHRMATPQFHKGTLVAISVPVRTRLEFALQRETERTRRWAEQGRLTEQQTGIGDFDEQIYLECDDPKLGQWLASSEVARALVLQLVDEGRSVELSGRKLKLKLTPRKLEPRQLTALASALKELAGQVPHVAQLHPKAQPLARRILTIRLAAAAVFLLALGGFVQLLVEMADPFPQHARMLSLLLSAGVLGAVIAAVLRQLCVRSLRTSSRAPRLSAELVLTLCVPLIALSVFGARYANLHGTAEPAQQTVVRLDRTYSKRNRRSTSHYMDLGPIEAAGLHAQDYRSNAALNRRLADAKQVIVHWRRGGLGSVIITREPQAVTQVEVVSE